MSISHFNGICSGTLDAPILVGIKQIIAHSQLISYRCSQELQLAPKGSSLSLPACCETKVS